jgi:hypothetical protein
MFNLPTNHQFTLRDPGICQKSLPRIVLSLAVFAIACASPTKAQALTIIPNFNDNLSVTAMGVINAAIGFYQTTFSDPVTVNIDFHAMDSGLSASVIPVYFVPYATYQTHLLADASSLDDKAAMSSYPTGPNDPILDQADINLKSANGRAVGINTPGVLIDLPGFCTGFTGDGCIGLNVSQTTTGGGLFDLFATVEHEINEVLGLGSSLSGEGTIFQDKISPEDLFRYSSSGVRSFALNDCGGTVQNAFFSLDQGFSILNQFNNCTNDGDYGNWITHTPSQVQDAFSNNSGAPDLTASSAEIRALDVIGYSLTKLIPAPTPVPEPVSVVLLAIGFTGLVLTRRSTHWLLFRSNRIQLTKV